MSDVKNISFRLDDETRKKLKFVAKYQGRSMNGQALHLVQECIRAFEKEHGTISAQELVALDDD